MSATVQQIFDMAIHLMDEQNEDTGETETQDTQEYRTRTISILNTVIPELYPYSSNYRPGRTGRPDTPLLYPGSYKAPRFEQEVPLDDVFCYSLLPKYLAGQLLIGEDEERSDRFMNQYQVSLAAMRNRLAAEFESITPPYGLF